MLRVKLMTFDESSEELTLPKSSFLFLQLCENHKNPPMHNRKYVDDLWGVRAVASSSKMELFPAKDCGTLTLMHHDFLFGNNEDLILTSMWLPKVSIWPWKLFKLSHLAFQFCSLVSWRQAICTAPFACTSLMFLFIWWFVNTPSVPGKVVMYFSKKRRVVMFLLKTK